MVKNEDALDNKHGRDSKTRAKEGYRKPFFTVKNVKSQTSSALITYIYCRTDRIILLL
jgi:hypothetical protein